MTGQKNRGVDYASPLCVVLEEFSLNSRRTSELFRTMFSALQRIATISAIHAKNITPTIISLIYYIYKALFLLREGILFCNVRDIIFQ